MLEEFEAGGIQGVEVVGGNVDVDVEFAVFVGFGGGEYGRLVVAFGAPCYVVGVAEGVDVDYVAVGGGEEDILEGLIIY